LYTIQVHGVAGDNRAAKPTRVGMCLQHVYVRDGAGHVSGHFELMQSWLPRMSDPGE